MLFVRSTNRDTTNNFLACTRVGDHSGSHFRGQISFMRSSSQCRKNVWLVLEWVSYSGSHFRGLISEFNYGCPIYEKTFFAY